MRMSRKLLLVALSIALPAGVFMWPARAARHDVITIATWNLEWLVTPEAAHASRLACRRNQHARLPCDVAEQLSRDSADFARLASYARELDADVIAFQEVESPAIAARIFSGYQICMADGPGMQHVGFALRPALPHRCGPAFDDLSLNGRSRKGMTLLLTGFRDAPLELLAVHLKSGCADQALDSPAAACAMLAQQAAMLGEWISTRHARGAAFIVLGDFNRAPPARGEDEHTNDAFWSGLTPPGVSLLAAHLPYRSCFIGQPYARYIDHMLMSPAISSQIIRNSARHVGYRSADVVRYRLSDHCPVSISLKMV